MIQGRDSSFARPSGITLMAAKSAGVRVWGGYIQTKSDVNLAAPWDLADFDQVRTLGGPPIAFCSGWDDPVALRKMAEEWQVRLFVDVENAIRPDGPWKVQFMAQSGAGLYGNLPVHNVPAVAHIVAEYTGMVPTSTWIGEPPPDNNPRGWQWQGTHSEFGLSVDSLVLDDWFGMQNLGDDNVDQSTFDALVAGNPVLAKLNVAIVTGVEDPANPTQFEKVVQAYLEGIPGIASAVAALSSATSVTAIKAELDAIKAELEAGSSVDAASAIARIEAALKSA